MFFVFFFFIKMFQKGRNMLNLKKEMATTFWLNVRIKIKYVLWAPMTFFMRKPAHAFTQKCTHIRINRSTHTYTHTTQNKHTFRQKHTIAQTCIQRYINTDMHIQKFRYKHTERRIHTYLQRHASTKTHAHIFIYTQTLIRGQARTHNGRSSIT